MPKGIIMNSGSDGATEAAVKDVLQKHGYEVDQPAPKTDGAEEVLEAGEEFEEEELEQPEPPRRRNRTQKAVEKAIAPLKEQVEALTKKVAAPEPKKEEIKAPAELKAPKREDFKNDDEFEDAKFEYRYQLRRQKEQEDAAKAQREEAQKAIEKEREKHWDGYKTKGEKFKSEHPDWDEVVGKDDVKLHPLAYEIIIRLENPAITYYLAQHPEVLDKLNNLDPYLIGVELGKLNDKLSSGATKPDASASETRTSKPTKALPEPVVPVRTSAVQSTLTTAEAAKHGYKAFKKAARAQAR